MSIIFHDYKQLVRLSKEFKKVKGASVSEHKAHEVDERITKEK
jgi:hypothetical protein